MTQPRAQREGAGHQGKSGKSSFHRGQTEREPNLVFKTLLCFNQSVTHKSFEKPNNHPSVSLRLWFQDSCRHQNPRKLKSLRQKWRYLHITYILLNTLNRPEVTFNVYYNVNAMPIIATLYYFRNNDKIKKSAYVQYRHFIFSKYFPPAVG